MEKGQGPAVIFNSGNSGGARGNPNQEVVGHMASSQKKNKKNSVFQAAAACHAL